MSAPTPRWVEDGDAPSYVELLPYHSVDPEGSVVLLTDNAAGTPDGLGMVWRLGILETEGRTDSDVGLLAARLDSVLGALPEGAHAQFLLRSVRDLRPVLDPWERVTATSDPVLAELASSRRAALEQFRLPSGGGPLESRRLEAYFTLAVAGQWANTGHPPGGNSPGGLAEAYEGERKKFLDLVRTLEALLLQAGVRASRLDEEALAGLLWSQLNPCRSRTTRPPEALPGELLRERVAASPILVDLDEGDLRIDDIHARIVSAVKFPARTRAGMLQRSLGPALIDGAGELEVVLNLKVLDQEEVRASFGSVRRLATDQSRDAHLGPTMAPHLGELVAIDQELSAGARVVSARLHVLVRAPEEIAAAGRAKEILAGLQSAGFRPVIENVLAGTIFLSCLPLGYRSDNDRALRRGRKVVSMNVAHLLPVYGGFQGTPLANQILLNRRGEPVGLSFFNGKEVPHAVVTGKSGAGKSVFANDLILNALRTGGRVIVLDRGGSYRRLAEMVGGAYVAYDARKPLRINPCGRPEADGGCAPDVNAFLRDWLTEICTHGKSDLPVVQQSLLSEAIRRAFQAKATQEVCLSDFQRALSAMASEHPAARDLAVCLSDFAGRGPYARFFDGANEIDFEKPFVAIDLADAAMEDSVASVLVMALMQRVASMAKAWPGQDKYLVIDEAWTLLRSPATARFIENVSRTARKARLSLVVLSQQLTDLEGKTGEAILAQSSYKVCLHQDAEAVRKAAVLLGLNAREAELYSTLKTCPGVYSELFVKSPFGSGVGRLLMDPLSYWLTTSDMADRRVLDAAVARHQGRGLQGRESLRSALIEVSQKFPRGAPGPART